MKRKWEKSEIEYLQANYSNMGISQIADALNRGNASIWYKAKSLNLANNRFYWTQEEKDYVARVYKRGNAADIAKTLRKSVHAVRRICNLQGLDNKSKKWLEADIQYSRNNYPNLDVSLAKMAKDLGTSVTALKTQAQRNGIFRKYYVPERFCADCGCEISKYFDTDRCITCSNKHRSGENHANWKGGISKLVDMIRKSLYPVWTYPIMERDNFTCQYCGKYQNNHVHHLTPLKIIMDKVFSDYPELLIDNPDDKIKLTSLVIALHTLEGGITVCKPCHISIHYSAKPGELLGSPNERDEGNQQPSRGNVINFVPRKVQRLTLEDSQTNNSDTSARHSVSATV